MLRCFSFKVLFNFRKSIFPTVVSTRMATSTTSSENATRNLLTILEQNPKRFKRIKFLANLFNSAGYELRIAGGAVRDIIRGVEPKDIDFATDALPNEFMTLLQKHEDLMRVIVSSSGLKHGTISVKFKEVEFDSKKIKLSPDAGNEMSKESLEPPVYDDESPFEITTLRTDRTTDGRHAEVEFVKDWQLDAERRDLTINAMFLTIDDGKLIDYFNGESDLKKGMIRFAGDADKRIKEDYLRILRFFRFWSRFGQGNPIDPETARTIRKNLDGLKILSGQRVWQELKKMLCTFPCKEMIALIIKFDLFKYIDMIDDSKDGYAEFALKESVSTHDNIVQYLEIISHQAQDKNNDAKKFNDLVPVIMFSSLIRTPTMALSAHNRMKFSNLERNSIFYIVENRDKTVEMSQMKRDLALAPKQEIPAVMSKLKALLIYKGEFDRYNELLSWSIPVFPLPREEVAIAVVKLKMGKRHIQPILHKLLEVWAQHDYSITEEDLRVKLQDEIRVLGESTKN